VIRLRNIFGWMLLVLACAGIFTAQVWKQNQYVKLTRDYEAYKAQLAKVKSEVASIQLHNKKLKDYNRLEQLAQNRFGLVYTGIPEFIYRERESRR